MDARTSSGPRGDTDRQLPHSQARPWPLPTPHSGQVFTACLPLQLPEVGAFRAISAPCCFFVETWPEAVEGCESLRRKDTSRRVYVDPEGIWGYDPDEQGMLVLFIVYLSTQKSAWYIVGVQFVFVTWQPPGNPGFSAEQFENLCSTLLPPKCQRMHLCRIFERTSEVASEVVLPPCAVSPLGSAEAAVHRRECS